MNQLSFDRNGQIVVTPDTPPAIRAAHDAVLAATAASEAAVLAVAHAVERQDAISKYIAANWKPPSFLDVFRAQTSSPGRF